MINWLIKSTPIWVKRRKKLRSERAKKHTSTDNNKISISSICHIGSISVMKGQYRGKKKNNSKGIIIKTMMLTRMEFDRTYLHGSQSLDIYYRILDMEKSYLPAPLKGRVVSKCCGEQGNYPASL